MLLIKKRKKERKKEKKRWWFALPIGSLVIITLVAMKEKGLPFTVVSGIRGKKS